MLTFRRGLVAVALLAVAGGVAVAAWPESVTTGSIGPSPMALPTEGNVLQDGRVVGWATGARRREGAIVFDAITDARQLEPSRKLDFAGYSLAVVQVRMVRYQNGDPAAGTKLEQVLTEIKGAPGK